jgi:hypothetical protein
MVGTAALIAAVVEASVPASSREHPVNRPATSKNEIERWRSMMTPCLDSDLINRKKNWLVVIVEAVNIETEKPG